MLCKDCKHVISKKVGYVSWVHWCNISPGKKDQKLGLHPWVEKPHPKCPLKNKTYIEERIKMSNQQAQTTKVVTGKIRMSYVNIFKPKAMNEGQEPKYSMSILIQKTDKVTLGKIKKAIEAAKQTGISSWGGKIPANLRTPLRDGDAERPDDEAYEGCYFINANSLQKPGIVDRDCVEILDPTEVYSGCYGRVSLNFFPYNSNGNRGIGCGLQNVQKLADGESLGGARASAESDFGDDFEDEDDMLG